LAIKEKLDKLIKAN